MLDSSCQFQTPKFYVLEQHSFIINTGSELDHWWWGGDRGWKGLVLFAEKFSVALRSLTFLKPLSETAFQNAFPFRMCLQQYKISCEIAVALSVLILWCPSLTHVPVETDRNMRTIYSIHTAQMLCWALVHLPSTVVCEARIICPSHFIDKQTKETQGALRNAHTAAIVSVEPALLLKFDLFMAALGLHCCTQAFSSCNEQGHSGDAISRLLISVPSLVENRALGAQAQ